MLLQIAYLRKYSCPIQNYALVVFYICSGALWQYRLWSFQTGDTKLKRFLPKNQHTQRKLLKFENWCNGEVLKSAKIPPLENSTTRIAINRNFGNLKAPSHLTRGKKKFVAAKQSVLCQQQRWLCQTFAPLIFILRLNLIAEFSCSSLFFFIQKKLLKSNNNIVLFFSIPS